MDVAGRWVEDIDNMNNEILPLELLQRDKDFQEIMEFYRKIIVLSFSLSPKTAEGYKNVYAYVKKELSR